RLSCLFRVHRLHRPATRATHSHLFSQPLPPPRPSLFPYTTLFRSTWLTSKLSHDHRRGTCHRSRVPHRISRRRILNAQLKTHPRSEEHTSELQSRFDLVCRLLLEKKKENDVTRHTV